ncbi:hypothetical protein HID58_060499, partial [Brassica napus]
QDEPADVAEEPSAVAEEPTVVAGEPAVTAKRGKRKLIDPGAESRKKQLLCQRAAEHNSGVSSEMKTFIEGLFTASFNSFKEVVQKDIHERFDNVANEVAQLKEQVSQLKGLSKQWEKATHLRFSLLQQQLEKTKDHHLIVRVLPQQREKARHLQMWILLRFVVALGQPPTLKDVDSLEDRIHDPDYSLVFVPEALWGKLVDWTKTFKELKIGPFMLTNELVSSVVGPSEWLLN